MWKGLQFDFMVERSEYYKATTALRYAKLEAVNRFVETSQLIARSVQLLEGSAANSIESLFQEAGDILQAKGSRPNLDHQAHEVEEEKVALVILLPSATG